MRHYQLRKTNNELTLKKSCFFGECNGGGGWDCIYMYIHLCSLCFGVTELNFQNSKKLSKNKMKKRRNKKNS